MDRRPLAGAAFACAGRLGGEVRTDRTAAVHGRTRCTDGRAIFRRPRREQVTARDLLRRVPLDWAARSGHDSVVALLVQEGESARTERCEVM